MLQNSTALKEKTVNQFIHSLGQVFFMAEPMLITGYRVVDTTTWERVERVDVIGQQQFSLVSASRRGVELLNLARGITEPGVIPLTEHYLKRDVGTIVTAPYTSIQARFYTKDNYSCLFHLETRGYELPRDARNVPDFSFVVQTYEYLMPGFQPQQTLYYGGIILRLVVESHSSETPRLVYGPHWPVAGVEPEEIEPGVWAWDLREGFDDGPRGRVMLDASKIANITVLLPDNYKNPEPVRIVTERLLTVNMS